MQMNDWIARARNHFVPWVAECLKGGEGKRLLDRFRDLDNDPILEALAFDLRQRLAVMDQEQRGFWEALFSEVGNDLALHLALMEPMAQSGGDLPKLISLFPEDLSHPKALAVAFESLRRGDSPLPPGITNTKGWSEYDIRKKLEDVKANLDWQKTTGSARKWWEAFENENEQRVALVLRLAEELAVRKATVTEFFLAYVYSNTDNIQANLNYLDYTRLKNEEERKKREAVKRGEQGLPAEAIPPFDFPTLALDTRSGLTNTKGWSDERIREKLGVVRRGLDWDNTTGSARKWWEAFENENEQRVALVLWLAEELAVRKATVTEFFLAYVYSNTDNIQANLSYLDYTRLKKEEERKKKEAVMEAAATKLLESLLPNLQAGCPLPELNQNDLLTLTHADLDAIAPEVRGRLNEAISLSIERIAREAECQSEQNAAPGAN